MLNELIQQLLDIEEIKKLKGIYCYSVAKEDWKTFESLFAEDLVFVSPGGSPLVSRRVFMEFHKKNIQAPKLWGVVRCHTPIITITGADTATGIWALDDLHIWPGSEGPRVGHRGYGHYYEEYIRLKEGWRFKRIEVINERMDPLEGGFGQMAGMPPNK